MIAPGTTLLHHKLPPARDDDRKKQEKKNSGIGATPGDRAGGKPADRHGAGARRYRVEIAPTRYPNTVSASKNDYGQTSDEQSANEAELSEY